MAIKKEIIFGNGIVVKYHKISKIILDNDEKTLEVLLKSYADDSYRQIEKNYVLKVEEMEELNKKINDIIKQIDLELAKDRDSRDESLLISLTEENNILANQIIEVGEKPITHIFETTKELTFSEEYNLESLYIELMNKEEFLNSIKV